MPLPDSKELPVNLLAACFNKTSATYKFYWFLSILQSVENGLSQLSKRELFSRMISNAWFTVNYFNISFGKQDLIQQAIQSINDFEPITIDEKRDIVHQKLLATKDTRTENILTHSDIKIITPYNAQVQAIKQRLPDIEVGTVDKFQGQEAQVIIYSVATSSLEEAPRGMDFLFSPNRYNVAVSRARIRFIMVATQLYLKQNVKAHIK